MSIFKLSAQLIGHSNDVKSVRYKSKDFIISASRDNSVRIWRQTSAPNTPPAFDSATLAQSGSYVNSLALIPPSTNHPDGLVVTSGLDPVIYVHEPKPLDQQSSGYPILLPGHSNNVCSLDVSPNGQYIVSGSWDTKAKIWDVNKWDLAAELDGHDKSVTAVLALKDSAAITGCADNMIRAYGLARAGSAEVLQAGKTLATAEPVRALCRLPPGHDSGAEFASAGNDFVIRLWTVRGQQVAELHGHESYVYSLACLPSGEIVSVGEDRTLRIWKGHQCVQTIVHPAVSVWAVDVCPETGDIVTGASDDIIRIWTRSNDRLADEVTLKHFDEAIKGMAIPKETMGGDLKNQEFPGPEFLQTNTGKKDGHVQVIKNPDGGLEAHIWSAAQNKWEFYGAVVDSPGSSDKKIHHGGKEWDFVFQVDIEDGKPTLPLPYNAGENPYDAARRFLEANELPIGYLEQVAAFIVRESKGQNIENIGAGSSAAAPTDTTPAGPKHTLPVREYVLIPSLNSEPLVKKILSLNADLVKSGDKEFAMNPTQVSSLQSFVASLQTALQSVSSKVSTTKRVEVQSPGFSVTPQDLDTIINMAVNWQYAMRLPALDLLRCLAVFEQAVTYSPRSSPSYLDAILSAAFETPTGAPINEASAFMAMRAVANSFATAQGRTAAVAVFPRVVSILEAILGIEAEPFKGPVGPENRNLNIAASVVMHNYAVLAAAQPGILPTEGLSLLVNCIGEVLQNKAETTTLVRALVALGTLTQVKDLSKTVRDLGGLGWARSAAQRSQDPEVREWVVTVEQALG
ncbi:ubiquitin homeostasis protein lub1 [Pyricularia oryzae]|nr:ubiquitin homeostasis protein lub1 [Pyricularia oryzae]